MSDHVCYECGEEPVYLYEGAAPPVGTIRKATCREHRFQDMELIERLDVDRSSSSISFPIEIDLEKLRIDQMAGGEWELELVTDDGERLYHYTNHSDGLYDQLCEQGVIDR